MFDYKPKYTNELLKEIENIEKAEIKEIAKKSAYRTIIQDIADKFNEDCVEEKLTKQYEDFCKRYPLAKYSLGIIALIIPKDLQKYILYLVFDICEAVEDDSYYSGIDYGYDTCDKEMREVIEDELKKEYEEQIKRSCDNLYKANKRVENISVSLLRKTDELIRTKEKLKEKEDFIQFTKDEIPDVYKKLLKECKNRKLTEER